MDFHWDKLLPHVTATQSRKISVRTGFIKNVLDRCFQCMLHVLSEWKCMEQRILDKVLGALSFSAYEAGSLCWDHFAVLIKGL